MTDAYGGTINTLIDSRLLRGLICLFVTFTLSAPVVLAAVMPTDRLGDATVAELPVPTATLAPSVSAAAGVLVAPDGRALWSRAPDERRAMASTTKIMTALVAMEHAGLDELVVITPAATAVGEAAARLIPGETYLVRTLLEAMLVRSGNDAALALAAHVAGDVPTFIALMNAKAQEMGLVDTSFANPHGLDAESHYTSARDLATLARLAMRNEEFRRMVALESVTVNAVGGPTVLENSNLLLGTLEGVTGVKTGWTNRAGYSLVASAERDGIELVAVVLGTAGEMDRFRDASLLLEWGFAHYREQRLTETGEQVGSVRVSDYLDVDVDVVVSAPANVPVFDVDGEVNRRISLPDEVSAPVVAGDRIGTLSLTQGERLLAQVPLIAAEDVRRPSPFKRLQIAFVRTWRSVFGSGSTELAPR